VNTFFLDASALSKRYSGESGHWLVDRLFERATPARLQCALIGAGEVISVLVRKKNDGRIPPLVFQQAMTDFTNEVAAAALFEKIQFSREQAVASWLLIEKHSTNATDALVLRLALDTAAKLRPNGHDLVLVASDLRLLRAAKDEELLTFDPERNSQAELDALIAAEQLLPSSAQGQPGAG